MTKESQSAVSLVQHSSLSIMNDVVNLYLKEKFGEELSQEVIERLDYELEIMNNSGFASYFIL